MERSAFKLKDTKLGGHFVKTGHNACSYVDEMQHKQFQ